MQMYQVTLQLDERSALEAIVQKGSHASRTVVNALILLNCDAGEFQPQRMRNEDVGGAEHQHAQDRPRQEALCGRGPRGGAGAAPQSTRVSAQGRWRL